MTYGRLQHIDIAKAVGMMLIIASHIWMTTEFQSSKRVFGFK